MSPEVMKKLVYIRYEKKNRKWMKRLGIFASEEQLKKGTFFGFINCKRDIFALVYFQFTSSW